MCRAHDIVSTRLWNLEAYRHLTAKMRTTNTTAGDDCPGHRDIYSAAVVLNDLKPITGTGSFDFNFGFECNLTSDKEQQLRNKARSQTAAMIVTSLCETNAELARAVSRAASLTCKASSRAAFVPKPRWHLAPETGNPPATRSTTNQPNAFAGALRLVTPPGVRGCARKRVHVLTARTPPSLALRRTTPTYSRRHPAATPLPSPLLAAGGWASAVVVTDDPPSRASTAAPPLRPPAVSRASPGSRMTPSAPWRRGTAPGRRAPPSP